MWTHPYSHKSMDRTTSVEALFLNGMASPTSKTSDGYSNKRTLKFATSNGSVNSIASSIHDYHYDPKDADSRPIGILKQHSLPNPNNKNSGFAQRYIRNLRNGAPYTHSNSEPNGEDARGHRLNRVRRGIHKHFEDRKTKKSELIFHHSDLIKRPDDVMPKLSFPCHIILQYTTWYQAAVARQKVQVKAASLASMTCSSNKFLETQLIEIWCMHSLLDFCHMFGSELT